MKIQTYKNQFGKCMLPTVGGGLSTNEGVVTYDTNILVQFEPDEIIEVNIFDSLPKKFTLPDGEPVDDKIESLGEELE